MAFFYSKNVGRSTFIGVAKGQAVAALKHDHLLRTNDGHGEADIPDETAEVLRGSPVFGVKYWEVNENGVPLDKEGKPQQMGQDVRMPITMKDGTVRMVTKNEVADMLSIASEVDGEPDEVVHAEDVPEDDPVEEPPPPVEPASDLPSGADLRTWRTRLGIGGKKASEMLGVSRNTYVSWEKRGVLTKKGAAALARALQLPEE